MTPLETLRKHVTGKIESGQASAIVERPAKHVTIQSNELLKPHSYPYAWTSRKLSESETWYKLFNGDMSIQIAFCRAGNDEDTLYRAMKDLQAMGYKVNGTQVITRKEAEDLDNKLYVLWNVYGEAKKVILYEFSDCFVSSTHDGVKNTWKLEKSHVGFTYSIKKTKIKTDGESFKRHVTDTMSPRGAFNTSSLLSSH
jgi:hypothetical protein